MAFLDLVIIVALTASCGTEGRMPEAYLLSHFSVQSVYVKDWQLAEGNYFDAMPTHSKCECRELCNALETCVAYSFNSSGICALSAGQGRAVPSAGAIYEYKREFVQLNDNLFYTPSPASVPRAECDVLCDQPGLGLPIIRTRVSFETLNDLVAWVGLGRTAEGVWLWWDGTKLDTEALGLTQRDLLADNGVNDFVVFQKKFNDATIDCACVCQGFFENVPS